jgi:hypothetical protein
LEGAASAVEFYEEVPNVWWGATDDVIDFGDMWRHFS